MRIGAAFERNRGPSTHTQRPLSIYLKPRLACHELDCIRLVLALGSMRGNFPGQVPGSVPPPKFQQLLIFLSILRATCRVSTRQSYAFPRLSQIVGIVPPSMTISVPVIAEARSEAAKATSSATSAGWLGRPSGIPPSMSISFCLAVV